ncbi:MAG: peptidylprolyl isomerase, partial [Desulfobulbaceae bacterium]|nr:peptidylprolyl isomerase [Desulfobulbaceae bacterium]
FEPFFTTKEIGTAMGLGLSAAYEIVTNNHKGNISVQSNPGTETTFTICLPIKT